MSEQLRGFTPDLKEKELLSEELTFQRGQSFLINRDLVLKYERFKKRTPKGVRETHAALVFVTTTDMRIDEVLESRVRNMVPKEVMDGVMLTSVDIKDRRSKDGRRLVAGDYQVSMREEALKSGLKILKVNVVTALPNLNIVNLQGGFERNELMLGLAAINPINSSEINPQE